MKKILSVLSAIALGASAMSLVGCGTDTHYDALVSHISVSIPQAPYSDSKTVVYQRITFDRDLASLSNISLEKAYLSMESIDDEDALAVMRNASISIMDPGNNEAPTTYWLLSMDSMRHQNEAELVEFNVGNLQNYMSSANERKVMIELELDPYRAMKYRLEQCGGKVDCSFDMLLSMTFEMSE